VSALRLAAQAEAHMERGFDSGSAEIVHDPAVVEHINRPLADRFN
jgi:hypothetical protein